MTPTTPSSPDPNPADDAVTGASGGPAQVPHPGAPTRHDTEDVAPNLGQQAASRLIQAAATTGQTVVDLDDDPSLRHAATSHGCNYELAGITAGAGPEPTANARADLLVVRWPRPDGRLTWMTRAPETMHAIRRLLAPAGLAALVLEPTPIETFTITWTGVLLSAAASAGLSHAAGRHLPARVGPSQHEGTARARARTASPASSHPRPARPVGTACRRRP